MSKIKKVIMVLLAIPILALGGMVAYEYIARPEPAHATSTTVTPISGDSVFISDQGGDWEIITKTKVAREGDGVKTGDNSCALITFEDGSTMTLDPNTEVTITAINADSISVEQTVGRTWSRFESSAGLVSEFDVETPAAAAVVRGTIIDIVVEEIGNTIVAAFEGEVEVTAQDITRLIVAGMQSLIDKGMIPEEPSPIPAPTNKLEVTINGSAWGLIVGPQGGSVGVVPPGIAITQIPGATTTGAKSVPQFIVVPVPETEGTYSYYIILYGKTAGEANVTIKGYAEGENIFTETAENMSVSPGTKYIATLVVTVDANGLITGSEGLSDFAIRTEEGPEKVELKDLLTDLVDEAVSPKANFSVEVVQTALHFTNLSTGDITGYSWDFGDGNTSEELNPNHTYGEAGEYIVTLTITGPQVPGIALEDSAVKEVYVVLIEE